MRQLLSELLASAKFLPHRMATVLIAAVEVGTAHSIGCPLLAWLIQIMGICKNLN